MRFNLEKHTWNLNRVIIVLRNLIKLFIKIKINDC